MINILISAVEATGTMTATNATVIGRLLTIGVVVIFVWIISGNNDDNNVSGRNASGRVKTKPSEN